jgi:hypothetical protein
MLDKILEFLRTMVEFFFIISGGDKVVALTIIGLAVTMIAVSVYGIAQAPVTWKQAMIYFRERSEGERVSFARSEHGKRKTVRITRPAEALADEKVIP